LDRILFEQEMARRAKELGVEIMLEKTVLGVGENGPGGASVLLDDGQELRSKVIIGADGVESTVGRSVGLTKPIPIRDMGTAAQYRMRDVDWDQDVVEVHMGEKVAPGGYVWIFPKGGDLLNVGVGSVGVGLKGENMPKPIELLDDFVAKRFPDAEVLEKMAGCVPVGPPLETAAKGRVMLVGDAARHSYAVGGGGIHSALLAGAMAGSCAGRIIKDASLAPIAEYDQMWKKAIYKSLSRSYKRKQWLYRSEKNMERLVTLGKIALPVVRVLPIDILKIWWGKYQPK
ncbi:MAG: FAD-dependent oxidoreductase, partial [Candidatus Thermoplasmatota archaeon]|nr:FAD-dependent oxidoreductase [Candidatus Thermoplasmatota archaeon]